MWITNLSLKNRLTIFVLIGIISMIGLISYFELPREAAPEIQIPVVLINTLYFGVSPSDMETLVTNPIEKKLKGLKDVKEITSSSGDSYSSIAVEFDINVDIDEALRKVKEKVDLSKPDLPDDIEEPMILEINTSDFPIMVVNIAGDYGLVKLKEIADDFKDQIETVKGVLEVKISGGLEREIQVLVDRNKLYQYGISLATIQGVIAAENINIPGGTIDVGNAKYLVRIPGEFRSVSELQNLVIDSPDKKAIYLKDIAIVKDHFKEKTSLSRLNHRESVSLTVQKRSGENVIQVSDEVKKTINEMKKQLPFSTEITIVGDESKEIRDMVDELENSILFGLILVILVLMFFMGAKNAFFVAIAIPLSMLISFAVLSLMGVTLNMVLLFSLILALGMLVDNAIVIVENIYRFIEQGHSQMEAAKLAAAEVGRPVIAATATTIAAFFPLLYMPGISGKFMRYLPIGVITTITASLFVALVINPVVCSKFMVISKKINDKKKSGLFNKIAMHYESFLERILITPKKVLLTCGGIFVGVIFLFILTNPGVEFFPEVTPDQIYVDIDAAEEATLDVTNQIVSKIESKAIDHANVARVITNLGSKGSSSFFEGSADSPNIARLIIEFNDEKDQTEDPYKTIQWLRAQTKDIPGALIEVKKPAHGPPSGAPIGIKVSGDDYTILSAISSKIQDILNSLEGIEDIKDDYIKGRPEVIVDIYRDKAALFEVNTSMIASTIRTAIQGTKVSVFREGNEEYDITLQLPKEDRSDINALKSIIVYGKEGRKIPLPILAKITTAGGVGTIKHTDLDRVITIEANTAKGFLPAERLEKVQEQLQRVNLPNGYKVEFVGESEMRDEMSGYLKKAFFIAVFLIGLILVTQFNSIILPFIIIISIFLSLIGILLGLIVFHRPFGIMMTGIGVISLAGVIVNNAIVLIEYIQQLRAKGMEKIQAVVEAGKVRLRPVLLTAITTILGLVPMTFGINFNFKYFFRNLDINIIKTLWNAIEIGAESTEFWGSMGSAVTIGLAVGTVLTLIVVPALYVVMDRD